MGGDGDESFESANEDASVKIAVDPGHGMGNTKKGVFDPGATAKVGNVTFEEAEITLQYGLSLNFLLRKAGIATFMTRDGQGDDARLEQRAPRAEQAGCTQFVSIHLNSFDTPVANGVEVHYRRDVDEELATRIAANIANVSGLKNREAKQSNFAVLKFGGGPAVLIELGFITSPKDRGVLLSGREMRIKICKAIIEALGISTANLKNV